MSLTCVSGLDIKEMLLSRASRGPAEDVKRQLVAAYQEVGLTDMASSGPIAGASVIELRATSVRQGRKSAFLTVTGQFPDSRSGISLASYDVLRRLISLG